MELESALGFTDTDFLRACEELDSQNGIKDDDEKYEFFVATHDVEIFRHYNEVRC